jgi:hypothetical protein
MLENLGFQPDSHRRPAARTGFSGIAFSKTATPQPGHVPSDIDNSLEPISNSIKAKAR